VVFLDLGHHDGAEVTGARRRALLTGFGPFRHWEVNSSGAAVELLGASRPEIATRVLPVDHRAAMAALAAAVGEVRPDILLMTGLADEPSMRLELRARRPAHVDAGAAALAGIWPWAASLDAIRATGAAARLSADAGAYVCETAYWAGLSMRDAGLRRVAFLHVPPPGGAWPATRTAAAVAACLDAGMRSG
jgi:pyroglutamyl-peptidase